MGKGKDSAEMFSLSGVLKMSESVLVFIAIMIHRLGDHGNYVFFGTTNGYMKVGDDGMDLENLGNGTLMTYAIISPILLLAYIIDGRYAIQRMFLEPFWNLLGTCNFLALGIKTIIIWHQGKKNDDFRGTEDYVQSYSAGLALGSICLLLGLIYAMDFWVSRLARNRLKQDAY